MDVSDLAVFCAKEHGIDIELKQGRFGGVWGGCGAGGGQVCKSKGREEQQEEGEAVKSPHGLVLWVVFGVMAGGRV